MDNTTSEAAAIGVVSMGAVAVGIAVNVATIPNNNLRMDLNTRRTAALSALQLERTGINVRLNVVSTEKAQKEQELKSKETEIQDEEKEISTFDNVINDANTRFMVALGFTGHGKSTVLNRLCGDNSKFGDQGEFKTGDGTNSVTTEPEHKECCISDEKSVLVDTPGYKDTANRDKEHLNNLAAYLYGCGGVDAFLLVMNGTNVRFDGNTQEMLKYFAHYFGASFWKHLVIVLTNVEYDWKEKYAQKDMVQAHQSKLKEEISAIPHDLDVPIVLVGNSDDYDRFRTEVMTEVAAIRKRNKKFQCTAIESPINELRKEKQALEQRIAALNEEATPLRAQLNAKDVEITDMQYKINHPEKIPLLTNFNGDI